MPARTHPWRMWILRYHRPVDALRLRSDAAGLDPLFHSYVRYVGIHDLTGYALLDLYEPIRQSQLVRMYPPAMAHVMHKHPLLTRDDARAFVNPTLEYGTYHPGGQGRRTDVRRPIPR